MAFMGIVLVAFIFMAIYMVIVYLINSSACMMLFTRGFSDKAWKAFIPFFNTFNLYYHLGIPYLYIVNVLVGIAAALIGKEWASVVVMIYSYVVNAFVESMVVKKFNQPMWLIVLGIFFPHITLFINGVKLGKGNEVVREYGPEL